MPKPKTEESLSERVQILLTPQQVAALDDYRFAARLDSRSEVIRHLVDQSLFKDRITTPKPK